LSLISWIFAEACRKEFVYSYKQRRALTLCGRFARFSLCVRPDVKTLLHCKSALHACSASHFPVPHQQTASSCSQEPSSLPPQGSRGCHSLDGPAAAAACRCCRGTLRSMRGGFIFRSRMPSLKVHHGQCLTSMTKHDSGGSPPGTACDSRAVTSWGYARRHSLESDSTRISAGCTASLDCISTIVWMLRAVSNVTALMGTLVT
jgi:hypothetical protein